MDEGKDYSALEKKLQEYKGLIEGLRAENKFIKTELIKINRTIRLIIDKLPQPIVVVSKDGKISFTNNSFIELLPYEARELSEKVPGLTDIDIRQVFPPEIHMLFLNSLHGGNDIVNAEIEIKEALMNLSIYCLKKGEQVLAIFRNLYDNNVLKKEEIASRIRDVIDKNMAMIQKIGFLMGEETSETTKILNSIIKSIGEKYMATNLFTDIACKQETYKKERICGDTFLFRRMEGGAHSIAVLSDGMGHGVKANVLSSLTASMIINFDYRQDDIREMAEMILKSLPICSIRKISYSTFSIVDINHNTGKATIIEYDNPQSLIYRNGGLFEPAGDKIILKRAETNRDLIIRTTTFDIQENDRIVIMSDGITQSGLGSDLYPFGWGRKNVNQFILQILSGDKQINSSDLAAKIMGRAIDNEPELTHDDITCAVISIRKPKSVLMCSCPPSSESEYPKLVETIDNFQGEKIICGYHLALLISKLKGVEILKDEFSSDPDVQPAWHMQGVNIITESLVTMSKVYDILQKHDYFSGEIGPAATVCKMLLESDEINMLIGTSRENGGFYMVDEFELRRKVMKYIARILEQKYMKEVNILYV